MSDWPLPDMTNAMAARHYRTAAEGKLMMQRCDACGHVRWPAADACPECLADGGEWQEMSGKGTIWSYAIYDRPLHPAFEGQCPYVSGLITLAEGPIIYARIEQEPDALSCGLAVEAVFETLEPGIGIVRFRKARED